MHKYSILKNGYTTGTCAAAAAKAALLFLKGKRPRYSEVELPAGEKARIKVYRLGKTGTGAFCEVIKDAGDDPDITSGAVIGASVSYSPKRGIQIKGGRGVGRVTRPGLAVAPGGPAINPVPRMMIRKALRHVNNEGAGLEVTIFVPRGAILAEKTLNPRLGITGGISILGTTGMVTPYSHAAYRDSIRCCFDVAGAARVETAVLSTGKGSEKAAMLFFKCLPESSFILMGDYFVFALQEAVRHNIEHIIVSCYPGKLLKMAAGAECTHYAAASIDLHVLADMGKQAGLPKRIADRIQRANTVRHAFAMLSEEQAKKLCDTMAGSVIKRIRRYIGTAASVEVLVVSFGDRALSYVTSGKKRGA